jgi:hypothetical protein
MPIISATISTFAQLGRACGTRHKLLEDRSISKTSCTRIKPGIQGNLVTTPPLVAAEIRLRHKNRQAMPEFVEFEELRNNLSHETTHWRIHELGRRAMSGSCARLILINDLVHIGTQLCPDLPKHTIRLQCVHHQPLELLNILFTRRHIAS